MVEGLLSFGRIDAGAYVWQLEPVAPSGSARGDRPVWSGREVDLFGTISPDGRFLTYIDWYLTGNLMRRDLTAGTSRPLTNNISQGEFGYADWSAISRRGDEVAYSWRDARTQRNELRVTTVGGAGVPASRLVIQAQGNDSFRPFDWSPDGQ